LCHVADNTTLVHWRDTWCPPAWTPLHSLIKCQCANRVPIVILLYNAPCWIMAFSRNTALVSLCDTKAVLRVHTKAVLQVFRENAIILRCTAHCNDVLWNCSVLVCFITSSTFSVLMLTDVTGKASDLQRALPQQSLKVYLHESTWPSVTPERKRAN